MKSNITFIIIKEIKRKCKKQKKTKTGEVTRRNQDLNRNSALAGGVRQINPKSLALPSPLPLQKILNSKDVFFFKNYKYLLFW